MSTRRQPWNERFLQSLTFCLSALLASSPAWAADWSVSRQLTTRGTYTDNLNLDATDATDAKSGFFVDLAPGLVVTGTGRRLNLNLAYSPQLIHYLSSSDNDELNHRLQANAQSELYRDHLFLDLSATARQELIDPLGPSGGDATSPTGNLQTTYTYSISPSYKNRFGRQAVLNVSVAHDGVLYSEQGDDSPGFSSQIGLSSGPAFGALNWGISAQNERLEFEESAATSFGNVDGSLGYRFNGRWRIDTSAGYENNDYSSLNETSGANLQASGTWTPTRRTSFKLGIGQRYFGWTPTLDFSHRSKRSVWTASYTRDVSSARNDRRQSDVFAFEDAFGEPIVPATGDTVTVRPGEATPTSATYVSNNFQAGYTLQTRRSTLGTSLRYVLREYEGLTQDEETAGASLFWSRRLTTLTSGNMALSWDRSERRNTADADLDADESNNFNFNAGLSRQLSARTNLDLQYRFVDGEDYTENRITLGLRMSWSD